MNKSDVAAVLARLMDLFEVSTDSDLARALGVNRQTLASWKTRNSVPYSICITVSEEYGASLDWLLTGRGSKKLVADSISIEEQLSPRECCWIEVFRELPEEVQKNILRDAEKEKRLFELEREVQLLKETSSVKPERKNTG